MHARTAVTAAGSRSAPLVLTCEHASPQLPKEYGTLGLRPAELRDHIGWDIGAAMVARGLAAFYDAPLVESRYSRLLIDCNRALDDHDLIVADSHGVHVPGNRHLPEAERRRRIDGFYQPYHDAIDEVLEARARPVLLLSVHSFTPELHGKARAIDVGVLYDDHSEHADLLFTALEAQSFSVRRNEPYSGLDGLIYSARSHGRRHRLPYLEIEVNNALLRREEECGRVAARVAAALREVL
jgi:predicted N-formylglutamate amidohydrolase